MRYRLFDTLTRSSIAEPVDAPTWEEAEPAITEQARFYFRVLNEYAAGRELIVQAHGPGTSNRYRNTDRRYLP